MSKAGKKQSSAADGRRRKAEQKLRGSRRKDDMPDTDARALLHELQVHQIELEMQNEELLRARQGQRRRWRSTPTSSISPRLDVSSWTSAGRFRY